MSLEILDNRSQVAIVVPGSLKLRGGVKVTATHLVRISSLLLKEATKRRLKEKRKRSHQNE